MCFKIPKGKFWVAACSIFVLTIIGAVNTNTEPVYRDPHIFDKSPVVWSTDFHIAPIGNVKKLLQPLGVKFIDKSLSGHCHLTNTCATNLRVLTRENGIAPLESVKQAFVQSYKNDPEFSQVDIVMCSHPSAMCELYMQLDVRLFVIATTRYEMGRHSKEQWLKWNENLKKIASNPRNVVAANNRYDQEYITYFTGIKPLLLPSVTTMAERYTGKSEDVIVTAMHTNSDGKISDLLKGLSPRFKNLRAKYEEYTYTQLCENTAILHIPYQLSIMSLFEQYAMGIPLLVPTPEFLWELHDQYDIVTERTWDRVLHYTRPTKSIIPGVDSDVPDPNNDRSRDAFLHWARTGDFYAWPHIVQFGSWEQLMEIIDHTTHDEWALISRKMHLEHTRQHTDIINTWKQLMR